jgi:glycine/D-amino acid oxidase-like deaminating enzyme/nitrite reductase/ring-hydroxylating ferredoxin subunit
MKGNAHQTRTVRSGVPLEQTIRSHSYPMAQGENILPDPPCTKVGGAPLALFHGVKSTSLWLDTAHPNRQPPLTRDAEADVCVIGAGIAGLTTAYLLAKEGRSVIVIDDGTPGCGMTGVTTAHLTAVIDDRYAEIIRLHGVDGARLACDSHRSAIARIESICQQERIDAGFARVSGYLFLSPEHDQRDLDEEMDAARQAGLEVEKLDAAPVNGFRSGPCLHFPRQAQFHPLDYLNGLVTAFTRGGGQLYGGVRATSVAGGQPAEVRTEGGARIRSKAVVVATNSPFVDLFAIHTKQAPYYTYVIAARIRTGSVTPALYWDTHDPYHYVRVQRTSNAALGGDNSEPVDLLIVGGEDHKTGQASDSEERFASLERWMRERFPSAEGVEFRWSGQVMETQDGLAFIGRNPMDRGNVYVATGDSGMGMTHGTIAGMLISDLIQGRPNRWTTLYDPSRKRLGAVGDFLKENLNVAAQYASYLTPGEVASLDEITPNTGAVVREGAQKVAVFRDEAGGVHRRSAVCTHLGCVVSWNKAASTWDCPCHGSRFDAYGRVLNGPASRDLEHLEAPAPLQTSTREP